MSFPIPTERSIYLGLMSGTSADGIDVALVDFSQPATPRMLSGHAWPWPADLRRQLVELGQSSASMGLDDFGELHVRIGTIFADAVKAALADSGIAADDVAAIGCHGQTLRHRPHGRHGDGRFPFTLQLGDASVLAERTGIAVVADFRSRDVAAGGQGAPLLPALHAALLHSAGEDRAVLNLGGIANLTLLPRDAGSDGRVVRGFDTGPANALMDAWCQRHTGQAFDRNGAFAASGQVDEALLARLLAEPWFSRPAPKSTGRDQFHLDWVQAQLTGNEPPADVQASLLAVTVHTVADALRATLPQAERLIVCGGGVHNPALIAALAAGLPDCKVESSAAHGLDPDYVEAMGFAWLARQTALGLPGNLASVTGAAGPRILGAIYPV
ncbi:anhydro-N-acetylmuramic acid kinase [Luteimonas sp. MJ293]|uniref:anhydro-N-acetylmuramic acid kinase n=1 Tax=Luteimonas sp. MJ146 TaxID=3129240 RepID=UPI0031B9C28D